MPPPKAELIHLDQIDGSLELADAGIRVKPSSGYFSQRDDQKELLSSRRRQAHQQHSQRRIVDLADSKARCCARSDAGAYYTGRACGHRGAFALTLGNRSGIFTPSPENCRLERRIRDFVAAEICEGIDPASATNMKNIALPCSNARRGKVEGSGALGTGVAA